MNFEQTTNVVTYLNRAGLVRAVEGMVAVWRDALDDLRYEDVQGGCRDLVRNAARAERAFVREVTPGEVRAAVGRIRAARIGGRLVPAPPDEIADDTAAALRFHREYLRALGDGAPEAAADSVACRSVGATRPAGEVTADPERVQAMLAGTGAVPRD